MVWLDADDSTTPLRFNLVHENGVVRQSAVPLVQHPAPLTGASPALATRVSESRYDIVSVWNGWSVVCAAMSTGVRVTVISANGTNLATATTGSAYGEATSCVMTVLANRREVLVVGVHTSAAQPSSSVLGIETADRIVFGIPWGTFDLSEVSSNGFSVVLFDYGKVGFAGAQLAFVLDSDGDGVPDTSDTCPFVASQSQTDTDGDGIGDDCDACPLSKFVSSCDAMAPPSIPSSLSTLVVDCDAQPWNTVIWSQLPAGVVFQDACGRALTPSTKANVAGISSESPQYVVVEYVQTIDVVDACGRSASTQRKVQVRIGGAGQSTAQATCFVSTDNDGGPYEFIYDSWFALPDSGSTGSVSV